MIEALARVVRVIDRNRLELRCLCGSTFVASRGEDGEPGEECCYDCSEASSEVEVIA